MDYTVHGILQTRILEWVAFPLSRGSSQPRDQTQVSRIAGGFFTSWATREAQEYWSGLLIPSPADLPDPGIEPGSPALQADSLQLSYQGQNINFFLIWKLIWRNKLEKIYSGNCCQELCRVWDFTILARPWLDFIQAGRKYKNPGSETKDFIRSQNISICAHSHKIMWRGSGNTYTSVSCVIREETWASWTQIFYKRQ